MYEYESLNKEDKYFGNPKNAENWIPDILHGLETIKQY